MKYKGTYYLEQDSYTIEADYEYYYDPGGWEYPPEEDLEIYNIKYNGEDFSDFFWDYVEDKMYDDILEYARENYPQ